MIDNVTLTFLPKTREDFKIYDSILSQFKYKRQIVMEPLGSYVRLFIYTQKKFIQIKVFHLNEFLGVNEVTNKDYIQFENQIMEYINPLKLSLDNLILTRIDYKLDTRLSEIEMQEYLYIFSKLRQSYYSLKKRVYWNEDKSGVESVYYKGTRFNINVYDKQNQLNKRGIHDPMYADTLRIELQVKTRELTSYCTAYGVTKRLINFWDMSVRNYFFDYILIERFLYSGDHFNLEMIESMLIDVKLSIKQKIIKFCASIGDTDITEATKTLSRGTSAKYIKELNDRDINPIPITRLNNLRGLKKIMEEKASEKEIC